MSVDPWEHPAVRVRAAAVAREGALAAWRHSPNGDTERVVIATINTLNYRLEQLWASLTEAQRAAVEARVGGAETHRAAVAQS
jgi:hypothetical protein